MHNLASSKRASTNCVSWVHVYCTSN